MTIPDIDTTDTYWTAILGRDARYDGQFVYGVRSTRIFCRPSCPSRRPGREQVEIFDDSPSAKQAGFRACLRCQPELASNPQAALVADICAALDEENTTIPSLEDLGQRFAMSPTHLQRMFTKVMGISPRRYAQARRLERLKAELRDGQDVTNALYSAGYGSSSRLYEQAHEQLGMTPASYGRGGKGITMYYAISDSPLGRLLVAATERGVAFVAMGDHDQELVQALRSEYPAATLTHDPDMLQEWVTHVVRHLEGQEPDLDLPLDIRATAFQQQVWQTLRSIPAGQTLSYGEIAEALGKPGAARAVGQACGSNPVAVIIPCHRAVAASGAGGGYRWGMRRKEKLLRREGVRAEPHDIAAVGR